MNSVDGKDAVVSDVREVIVIGGGPAGYTAALYAARANLNPLLIEGFAWGGQLMITSDVENYPGYPDGIMGPAMMQDFRRQSERFGAEFLTDDVTRVEFGEHPFRVWVGEREFSAESVIVATGASARQLGLETERTLGRVRDERWGPRTVDLDLLVYGERVIDEPGLRVPHSRLGERRFALEPLADPIAANQARTYTREGSHNFRLSNVALDGLGIRRLTPRECERLQGFPDDYQWVGSKMAIARQIGNAVPVPLGAAIAHRLLACLE